MEILLAATYEMGRQPFGLASAAAFLERAGYRARVVDLSLDPMPHAACESARVIAFHLPMHTATRLAAPWIERAARLPSRPHVCCFGLYAPINEAYLRGLGAATILGGECEENLVKLVRRVEEGGSRAAQVEPVISLDRLEFPVPARGSLPPLSRYAGLRVDGELRVSGYTEASRGCKHTCRHCPVVPVYQGKFRVVDVDKVLADIRQQVEAGARHITFGDPDFFNGPLHAKGVVERVRREFPSLTFDVTIKIEHLLRHRDLVPLLKESGCLFVTSAVESLDDAVLARLAKGHTRRDFFEAVELMRAACLPLSPTFIAFTPWTTRQTYLELLRTLAELDLVANVAPVQLALRLLIPSGSLLLELAEIREWIEGFDASALVHRWRHPDAEMDALERRLLNLIDRHQKAGAGRTEIFQAVWSEASKAAAVLDLPPLVSRAAIPYLTEPWYC